MIEFLTGNGSNVCSLDEARKVIEVTQAIFESDRLNTVVTL
jgi:hypothetical protein